MKHVIVIETPKYISPSDVDGLRNVLTRTADKFLGENNFLQLIANQPSAIRGVYTMFHADQSLSPDQLGSAEE